MNYPYIKQCQNGDFAIVSFNPREIAEWQSQHWEETGHKFYCLIKGKRVVS